MNTELQIPSRDGKTFFAYYAEPKVEASAPVLILLPEVYNVNAHIRAVCDEYAACGFHVIAPDLYWRQQPEMFLNYTPEDLVRARDMRGQLDTDQYVKDLEDCAAYARALPGSNGKVAMIGYCIGGKFAYLSSARFKLDAAISYYGGEVEKYLDEGDSLSCKVLMHFAENDASIPQSAVDAVATHFAGNDRVKIHVYPGTLHAFNRRGYAPYNPEQAAKALLRSLEFLRGELA